MTNEPTLPFPGMVENNQELQTQRGAVIIKMVSGPRLPRAVATIDGSPPWILLDDQTFYSVEQAVALAVQAIDEHPWLNK